MKSITKGKPPEEILNMLKGFDRVFIVGCGTCTTMTRTGGRDEVIGMCRSLEEAGKLVTGWEVIPVACDEMTEATLKADSQNIREAGCILIMTCALGVHRVSSYLRKPAIPALDTLFIGIEKSPGSFQEVCAQCGQCVLGLTAGICPHTACHKGLLNGPCGGTNNGKCEVSADRDCGWSLIYEKLTDQGRLELMYGYQPPHNYQAVLSPRILTLSEVKE